MGRPPKRNLNYSTWDVNVLENDTSIDNLIDAQGPAGFYVYFALCQKAYATDGYFYRWGYELAKSRLSIRFLPPYSEERRQKASEYAKKHGLNSQQG